MGKLVTSVLSLGVLRLAEGLRSLGVQALVTYFLVGLLCLLAPWGGAAIDSACAWGGRADLGIQGFAASVDIGLEDDDVARASLASGCLAGPAACRPTVPGGMVAGGLSAWSVPGGSASTQARERLRSTWLDDPGVLVATAEPVCDCEHWSANAARKRARLAAG